MMRTKFPRCREDALEKKIYKAADSVDLVKIINHFIAKLPGGTDDASVADIISVIQDAWNYLPHRSLDGRSPADLMATVHPSGSSSR
jgi:hypothetical protein